MSGEFAGRRSDAAVGPGIAARTIDIGSEESIRAFFAALGVVDHAESVAGPTLALMASPYATGTVLDIDGGGLLV